MKTCRVNCWAVLLVILVSLSSLDNSYSAVQYTVIGLGLNPNPAELGGINNQGKVVGQYQNYACLWDNGQLTFLETGHPGSIGKSINNQGQVLVTYGRESSGFIWDRGTTIPLHYDLYPFSINDEGYAVGYTTVQASNGDIYIQAAMGKGTQIRNLGTLGGGGNISFAYDINNSLQVVGSADYGSQRKPVIWDTDGFIKDIGLSEGQGSSRANAINENGQVIGDIDINTETQRSFLWQNDVMQVLEILPTFTVTFARGINNLGIIVGLSRKYDGPTPVWKASIWKNGQPTDLNILIDPESGWRLQDAYGINDMGQIIGVGYNPDGQPASFLLNPVPEPASLLLFGILTICGCRRKR